MINKITRQGRILFALLPPFVESNNPYDRVVVDNHGIFEKSNETGWDRLKALFQPYENKKFHPRLIYVTQMALASFVGGAVYGAVTYSRTTFIQFIENNEATKFESHYDAKRRLSDKMFLGFMKGGAKWGVRVSFFCTSLVTAYTLVSVYKGEDSVWYYSIGGACAGAVYKFPLGPKGMISGAVFGGIFGSMYGGLKYVLLILGNRSETEIRGSMLLHSEKKIEKLRDLNEKQYMKEVKAEMEMAMNNYK